MSHMPMMYYNLLLLLVLMISFVFYNEYETDLVKKVPEQ